MEKPPQEMSWELGDQDSVSCLFKDVGMMRSKFDSKAYFLFSRD